MFYFWILSSLIFASAPSPIQKEFEGLVSKICQMPCNIDAVRDQADRALINEWLLKYEGPNERAKAKQEVCLWFRADGLRKETLLTEEKRSFIEARLKERKSPLKGMFTPICNTP